ncbi:MAG: PilZ domain-containing protein [Candidatus Marithrix sp.]|nr:PilZ domain-containing protein [Candidatus Marithrix sp.]
MSIKEIEEALNRHPDVQDVVVIEHQSGDLVAYIISRLIPDRLPYHSACSIEYNQKKITVHTDDISYNGFCIIGAPLMKKDDSIRLYIRLPGDTDETWFNGKIAWYRDVKAGVQLASNIDEQKNIERGVNYILNNHGFLKILQRVITGRLRKFLSKMLPDEKLPDVFMIVPSLPIKKDGQVDIDALPKPGISYW